nr:hypothetical protein [Tanacetum cinerariifolium]
MVKTNSTSENKACYSKSCKKNTDSLNSKITNLTDKLFDAKNMIYHYKLGLAQVESRLVEHKDRESNTELELIKKEKEGLDGKLAGFQTASKDLDSLLESQRLDKNKEGLGYSDVLPPPAQLYSPPKKDLSWTGLPEFADDTVTDYSRPSPAIKSTSGDVQNRNTYDTKTKASPSTISPKPLIKFVKVVDRPAERPTTNKVKTAKKPAVKHVKTVVHWPNMNSTRPQTTQYLMIILIQRVQRLERELKARTLIHKVNKGRSRLQPSGGYNVVSPLITRNFMPPKPDLVVHTTPIAVETDHSAFTVQLSTAKPAQDLSHITRPMAPIIEDWVSDLEDESEPNDPQSVPSFV